jgi:hypothetical protein
MMIRLQVVVVDLAIVKMVYPWAIVMILPQVMVVDFPVMDVMPGVEPGTPIVQMLAVEEMPGVVTGMVRPAVIPSPGIVTGMVRPAVIPFSVIGATGKEENAGNQDQEAAKNSHDVHQVLVIR